MNEKLHNALRWVASALDTHSKGSSARKWSAFIIIVCVVFMHVAWLKHAFLHEDFTLLEGILIIDYGFIAALLGMTTYQAIKSKQDEKPTDPE